MNKWLVVLHYGSHYHEQLMPPHSEPLQLNTSPPDFLYSCNGEKLLVHWQGSAKSNAIQSSIRTTMLNIVWLAMHKESESGLGLFCPKSKGCVQWYVCKWGLCHIKSIRLLLEILNSPIQFGQLTAAPGCAMEQQLRFYDSNHHSIINKQLALGILEGSNVRIMLHYVNRLLIPIGGR